MTGEPLAVGAVGDVATSSLLWRYGGQLHLCVTVRARYLLVDDGVATRVKPGDAPNLAPADDPVPYRQGCDVWMVGHCNATPMSPTAPLTTRITLSGSHEQLLDKQHRLMMGSDLGVAGYGPRRINKWLPDLIRDGVVEIPQSFDWSKMHAAPTSQRVRYLHGGERLTIESVLEGRKSMRSRLPNAHGEARIWSRGTPASDPGYAVQMVADTLGIDADTGSIAVVWRGSFPIDDVSAPSRMIIGAAVSEGEAVDWGEGWIMANTAAIAHQAPGKGTLDLVPGVAEPAVPFSPARPSQPHGEALRPATIEGAPWSERAPSDVEEAVADGDPGAVPAPRERAMTLDIEEGFRIQDAALPFQPTPAAPGGEDAGPWSQTDPVFDIAAHETVETPPRPSEEAATPFETSGSWEAAPEAAETAPSQEDD